MCFKAAFRSIEGDQTDRNVIDEELIKKAYPLGIQNRALCRPSGQKILKSREAWEEIS